TQDMASMPILGESDIKRHLLFAYLQDEWILHPDWTLTSGVRYDHYSDFGSTINPRSALVWNTRHNLTLKFLYGRGFREPSLLETQAQQVPAIRGNAHLNPETLNSFDLAVDYRPRLDLQTRVNFFYHVTDNQIRLQQAGFSYWPENVGKQKGHGIELEWQWDITPVTRFYGYYAYQANTDETTGKDAGYTPHHKVFAQVQRQSNPWLFNVQATYIGPRDRVAEDPRSSPQTYTLVDVRTRYDFSDHFAISLDIRNLFDKNAKEAGFGTVFPGDMPLPGRNYYLTLFGRF
ncbi:MAG TPA: TonB-dependent receptor, partial [Saprospiraceae bacterium]|nr:TonB-dependent receptor [Saprospiraceae bacterium]